MPRLLIVLVLLSQIAFAQTPQITFENFSIHAVPPGTDGDDLDSNFPIVHTGTIQVDGRINGALERRYLGRTLNKESIADIRKDYSAMGDHVYSYSTEVHDRFIIVRISQHQINNTMSLNGYENVSSTLFDLRTGLEISPLTLFSDEGSLRFLGKAFPGFRKSFNENMDRYITGFSGMKKAKQLEACDCDCESMLHNAFLNGTVNFSFSAETIGLNMDGCGWQNPGPHDTYGFSIPMKDARPWLSDFGKYMLDNGPAATLSATRGQLMEGLLGENIYATFILKLSTGGDLTGYEIYHSVGEPILLKGKANGSQLTFDEVSPQGVSVATFQAVVNKDHLSGTWTKSDKSKTLDFSAVLYPDERRK